VVAVAGDERGGHNRGWETGVSGYLGGREFIPDSARWTAAVLFACGVLACCWAWTDVSPRAKLAFSVFYVASWGLFFIPFHGLYLFPLAQCGALIFVAWSTLGTEYFMKRRH
jgi:CHASE2 domain-containing sensor protein